MSPLSARGGRRETANGNVKPSERAVNDGRDDSPASSNEDDFGKEVRALGGTHDDVELVADAQSDSELEGTEAPQTNQVVASNQKGGLEERHGKTF